MLLFVPKRSEYRLPKGHIEKGETPAATALREKLLATTALYGSGVHVQVVGRLDQLPFAAYFANAIIVAGLPAVAIFSMTRPNSM